MFAMLLNNEKQYATSEKSARYTEMKNLPEDESVLYEKWREILEKRIAEVYPNIKEANIKKLAMENARYMIYVFTPTKMRYSTSLRQLNYISNWIEQYIENEDDSLFNERLKTEMKDFLKLISPYGVEGLVSGKNRKLSLISEELPEEEYFGDVYSTKYIGSFAQLAQAQRHRTINYTFRLPEHPRDFYVPKIIRENEELVSEWLADLASVADSWPQATLIEISEMGTLDNFLLKCWERLCGHAQLEVMNQTEGTLKRYIKLTKNKEIKRFLEEYNQGPKCTFPNGECSSPCNFGKKALERKI
jgi:hypothetical protein